MSLQVRMIFSHKTRFIMYFFLSTRNAISNGVLKSTRQNILLKRRILFEYLKL